MKKPVPLESPCAIATTHSRRWVIKSPNAAVLTGEEDIPRSAPFQCDLQVGFARTFYDQRSQLAGLYANLNPELDRGLVSFCLIQTSLYRVDDRFDRAGDLLKIKWFRPDLFFAVNLGRLDVHDGPVVEFGFQNRSTHVIHDFSPTVDVRDPGGTP